MSGPPPLPLRDYTITHRATGLRALNRRELREGVRKAPDESLFLHFWGRLLRPGRQSGEYGNDLANWAAEGLHDLVLAERLALIDPRRHPRPADLRRSALEILESRVDAPETQPAEARDGEAFHFLVVHAVLYDAGEPLRSPAELPRRLPDLSPTTLLHHFVDAPGSPVHAGAHTREWLREWDGPARELADRLETTDLFLHGQEDLEERLTGLVEATLGNGANGGAR